VQGLALKVNKRDVLGKKTRFLRRQGVTPAHLFGHGLESLSLQCDTAELQHLIAQAGTTRLVSLKIGGEKQPESVLIREIQRDACTGALLHVGFYQVRMKEKIKTDIPIVLVGEAPAMKEKGRTLTHGVTKLSIECLPDKLPSHIEVDLISLEEVEQSIHVRDIILNPDITVVTDPDQMIAKVSEARVERVEEVEEVAEAAAEVEAEAPTEEEQEQQPSE